MLRKIILVFGCLALLFILGWQSLFLFDFTNDQQPTGFGVSFSPVQTEYLGLDDKEVYRALLDDLAVRYLRLGVYWNRVEKSPGVYDFTELDYYMGEASKRGAKVILAIGRRIPRWPECHDPPWVGALDKAQQDAALNRQIVQTVERYKNHPTLEMWQVENEPFLFIFGKCGKVNRAEFRKEVALVRQLDPNHPTITSDSGELATWFKTAPETDYFGSTVYRVALSPLVGHIDHEPSIPAAQYRLKAWLVRKPVEKVFLIEVQAEPWALQGIRDISIEEQFKTMDIERFKRTAQFARQTGFPRGYLWGVEWWYWLSEQGYPDHWDYAKTLF